MEKARTEQLGGSAGLLGALCLGASPLTAGEGQQRHAVPPGGVAQEDPADADLRVVGVRADGQHRHSTRLPARARPLDELAGLFDQRLGVERLDQVVVGPGPDGAYRVLE